MVFDGSPKWTLEHAFAYVERHHLPADALQTAHDALTVSLRPAPMRWLRDRLTVLAAVFTVGRIPSAPEDITLWLWETSRLLSDLPHDILGQAIDAAIRKSPHGFMPSVGEIMSIAEPRVEERHQQIARLAAMLERDPIEGRAQPS